MSVKTRRLSCIALSGIPEINTGDDIASITFDLAKAKGDPIEEGDVLVVAQKIVSKAEGRFVDLKMTEPSVEAIRLAEKTGKDPRLVQQILNESIEIVRAREGLIIARHHNGFVVANAGIDLSNSGAGEKAILLPLNPDLSAERIARDMLAVSGKSVAVIVNDSMGRAWRNGTSGIAIGSYGLAALQDRRGQMDRDKKTLQSSEIALADEIAAAGSLLMGQGDESLPIVILRGLNWVSGSGTAAQLVRPLEQDLFK